VSVHLFGIRHHGPGCARALRAALDALAPDVVLVEGPPDGQDALPLLAHPAMRPPVALLIYAPESPHAAVYYPFAVFSPEWQALSYALARGIPARFVDLPQAVRIAQSLADVPAGETQASEAPTGEQGEPLAPAADAAAEIMPEPALAAPREDPLALLAEAAGYADHELWWDRQIEQRRNASDLFAGILEAMAALRSDLTPADEEEARREAHMRQCVSAAEKEGFERIAVVCGAWHAPALGERGSDKVEKADAALLAGLKRAKVAATWIPWTNSRLSARSGYGAGIAAPGWYEHLWASPDTLTTGWMTRVARVLRGEGLDASSASVIEAARLTEALAALRGLPAPGLAEMHEAAEAVLCAGDAAPMRLIREQLEIGERMGEVPPETPMVPLQRDLDALARRLRLDRSPTPKVLELDLRKETDRARSQLLHRLRLLGIEWGKPQRVMGRKLGTFHEHWQLEWQVEFAVAIIEANVWGNTVAVAASAAACSAAEQAAELDALTALLDRVILAELPGAVEHLLVCLRERAAVSADIRRMMDAIPPLARIARYGDVRGTAAGRVLPVFAGLFERIVIGLPAACASLDDAAADGMATSLDHMQEALALVDDAGWLGEWQDVLWGMLARAGVHGLVRGRCCRLLLERGALAADELRRLAGLALSPAVPAPEAAAWVEGVARGSGMLLLAQDGLWSALDAWVSALSAETFTALLPLLRRAFSEFHPPERRAMGQKVQRLRAGTAAMRTPAGEGANDSPALDERRARLVLPVLAQILGVSYDGER
jgi:hypothetical protein